SSQNQKKPVQLSRESPLLIDEMEGPIFCADQVERCGIEILSVHQGALIKLGCLAIRAYERAQSIHPGASPAGNIRRLPSGRIYNPAQLGPPVEPVDEILVLQTPFER